MSLQEELINQTTDLLCAWARWAEQWWYAVPGRDDIGCFGTGYGTWGTQTNQKYLAAMATLADVGPKDAQQWALDRALAALRYELATHITGDLERTDGKRWGHHWLAALGIERMMHGVHRLEPHLTSQDREQLRAMLLSEAQWSCDDMTRGNTSGIVADVWGNSGKNAPESNLWQGALLWRVAHMYPDHARAADFIERAHDYLVNSVSVAADAQDDRIVAGKPVRERHVGANFFSNYALDHHGYLNIGYMVICVSNAAMLHFDMRQAELDRPETLDHHQADLWSVLRKMIFSDGRLARIGGDSRVPYTYCQEYLIPALLYASDHLGDEHGLGLLKRQLEMIQAEADFNADGSFYRQRLSELAEQNPYYFTRLESDRACVLSMLISYLPLLQCELESSTSDAFQETVTGNWHEPEYGAAMHRSPTRLASVAWRANDWPQLMCQPPDDGHLADWWSNLVGVVHCLGDRGIRVSNRTTMRRLIECHTDTIDGGFVSSGSYFEGTGVTVLEGLNLDDQVKCQLAVVALPDGQTMLVMHRAVANMRVFVQSLKGLHLNVPNDLFNGMHRTVRTESGEIQLSSPPNVDEVISLQSNWANIDNRLGVIGLFGAESFSVSRAKQRRGGRYGGLYVDEICWPHHSGIRAFDKGEIIFDIGYVVLSATTSEQTNRAAADVQRLNSSYTDGDIRWVRFNGADGNGYVFAVNFGHEASLATMVSKKLLEPGQSVLLTD